MLRGTSNATTTTTNGCAPKNTAFVRVVMMLPSSKKAGSCFNLCKIWSTCSAGLLSGCRCHTPRPQAVSQVQPPFCVHLNAAKRHSQASTRQCLAIWLVTKMPEPIGRLRAGSSAVRRCSSESRGTFHDVVLPRRHWNNS